MALNLSLTPVQILIIIGVVVLGVALLLTLDVFGIRTKLSWRFRGDQRAAKMDEWLGTQGVRALESTTTFVCKRCNETWPSDMLAARDTDLRGICTFCVAEWRNEQKESE